MRVRVAAALVLLTAVRPAGAQTAAAPAPAAAQPAAPVAVPAVPPQSLSAAPATAPGWAACDPCASLTCCPPARSCELWMDAAYLLWWVKDGPLRFPLVTTGNPALGGLTGALGQPGTAVLFGGNGLDYGAASGFRVNTGVWFGEDRNRGLEFGALFLTTQQTSFFASTNASGSPPLFIPAFNAVTGAEGRLVVGDPTLGLAGNVGVVSESRLWGFEVNGSRRLASGWGDCSLLAGFRYLSLDEELTITNSTADPILGQVTTVRDRFATENQFYGGQIGARMGVERGFWTARLTAKMAFGWTHEVVDVAGSAAQSGSLAGPLPGGFFAQSTNTGRRSRDEFAFVPEVNFRAGCRLLQCLSAFAGYDFLYWSRVARPGDQIDRVVNQTQSPVFGIGTLVGPARPAPLINSTGYFAHGFSFGLELRY